MVVSDVGNRLCHPPTASSTSYEPVRRRRASRRRLSALCDATDGSSRVECRQMKARRSVPPAFAGHPLCYYRLVFGDLVSLSTFGQKHGRADPGRRTSRATQPKEPPFVILQDRFHLSSASCVGSRRSGFRKVFSPGQFHLNLANSRGIQ